MKLVEWCHSSSPIHTNTYVPIEHLTGLTGFRSYFAYIGLNDGDIPKKNATTLYCDTLIIDIDGELKNARSIIKTFEDFSIAFEVYSSGSKGFHIHVPIAPMVGTQIHRYIKHYITSNFGHIEGVDTSMIHPRGLIRLPNTTHAKTGKRKTLLIKTSGVTLEIPEYDLPEENERVEAGSDLEALYLAVKALKWATFSPPRTGERHKTLWKLAKYLEEAGIDHQEALELLQHVNNSWPNSKGQEEVIHSVKGAYK